MKNKSWQKFKIVCSLNSGHRTYTLNGLVFDVQNSIFFLLRFQSEKCSAYVVIHIYTNEIAFRTSNVNNKFIQQTGHSVSSHISQDSYLEMLSYLKKY